MTKFSVLAIACSLLLVSSSQAALTDGLVSYWPFDGSLQDKAGDGHGVLYNHGVGPAADPATYTGGPIGQGIDLDGVDQYVLVDNDESKYDFDTSAEGFSVSTWFRVDAFSKSWQALIAKGEGNRWRVHRRGGENLLTGNGGNADVPAGTTNVNDGAFHHLALVSRPGVGVDLFIDGILESSGPAPSLENNAMQVHIGSNPDTGNRTWDGVIDDTAIWGRALSAGEVRGIHAAGLRGIGIPEPTTAAMATLALLGWAACGRRRR